jgi:hypothetical protein
VPKDGLDGRVQLFDDTEANRMILGRGDPVDVGHQRVAERLHLGQALPGGFLLTCS